MDNKTNKQEEVIAKIGDRTFTNYDFQRFLSTVEPRIVKHFMNQSDGFKSLLEEMINQELMLLYAKDERLENDEEFKKELDRVKDNLLKNYAYDKTIRSFEKPTDEEALNYFNEHKEEFKKPFVNASHILVKSEKEANEVLSKIDNGEKFEDLAKEYSTCPSKENGGNLGDFTKGQMVLEFENAVFNMKENEIKGPVKTEFGFHIIKLNKINSVQEANFEESKNEILMELSRQKQLETYKTKTNELKDRYNVELFL